jgi:hypothetical protein
VGVPEFDAERRDVIDIDVCDDSVNGSEAGACGRVGGVGCISGGDAVASGVDFERRSAIDAGGESERGPNAEAEAGKGDG